MADKPLHLRDIFTTGKLVTVSAVDRDGEKVDFEIYIRKPTASDHQEVSEIASAKAARIRAKYRDKESSNYISLMTELEEASHKELVDMLVMSSEDAIKRQAYNKVLYDEEFGSDWSEDGKNYLSVVMGLTQRLGEIEGFNASLSEEDTHLIIRPEDDEEFQRLSDIQEEFQAEVSDYIEKLLNRERMKHGSKSTEAVRSEVMKLMIDTEVNLARFWAYRSNMVWRSCRDVDNKKSYYFKDVDEMESLPSSIKNQLYEAFDSLDPRGDDLKNLLSLLPS